MSTAAGTATPSTNSADVLVLCAGAMHGIMNELVPAFERSTSTKLAVTFASSGGVKNRVLDGESVDVVITTQSAIDDLAGNMRIAKDSIAIVARSPIGVAVRAGAAKPDVSTVDAFKHALLQASSIAYADPSTGSPSANHFVKVLDRLGLTSALEPKTRLAGAAPGSVVVVCDLVAGGEAEIGIQQISEILGVAGVELVGPLPTDLQHLTVFSAAVGALAKNPEASRRFVAFLTSSAAGPAIEANGMVRG
jgi:molybdate transport system substrate-binding protein